MKHLLLLIVLTATAFTGSSQALTPALNIFSEDTVLCFSTDQSRALAKHLVKGLYCDSILHETQAELAMLNHLVLVKDSSNALLKQKNLNYQGIILNRDKLFAKQSALLADSDKRFRRERQRKRRLEAGLFIVSSLSFAAIIAATH